mgnify:CR=1 FL=1
MQAVALVRDHITWRDPEFESPWADHPFFTGEVEPCINGNTVATGAYFGVDMTTLVERLLGEQLADRLVVIDSATRGLSLGMGISHRVDYTIKMPRGAQLTIRSTNGDIEVKDVEGRFEATTTNGRVIATGLGEGARVSSTNGVITLNVSSVGEGVSCETVNGVIDVSMPANAKADISAQTTNGVVSYSGLELSVSESTRRRLEGSVGGGGPRVRLRTTNGAIRIQGR